MKKILLAVIVLLLAICGCECGKLEQDAEKENLPPVKDFGGKAYINIVAKNGERYAKLVVPNEIIFKNPGERNNSEVMEKNHAIAKVHIKNRLGPFWADEQEIYTDKENTTFVFRKMTEGEVKAIIIAAKTEK